MNQGQSDRPSQQAKDTASQVTQDVREKSSQVAQQAQEQARQTLEQQKGRAAGSLGIVADALRETGKNLNNQDQAAFGRFAEKAASSLETFSSDLQNKSVGEIVDQVEDFARRDPQLFLGGAVVLGLLAARFLKSSNRPQYRYGEDYGNQWGSGRYYRSYPQEARYGQTGYGGTQRTYRSTSGHGQERFRGDETGTYTGSTERYGTGTSMTQPGTAGYTSGRYTGSDRPAGFGDAEAPSGAPDLDATDFPDQGAVRGDKE